MVSQVKPFRIRHDDPFYKPHKRPDYVDYSTFNPHTDEGPRGKSSSGRVSQTSGIEVLRNDRRYKGVSINSTL